MLALPSMATAPDSASRPLAFLRRIGGMLVAPRTILDEVRTGGPGGLPDLLLLLLLQLIAVHLQQLVRATWFMLQVSYAGGISTLLNTISQSVLAPVVGAFIGVIVLHLMTRGRGGGHRNLDMAALCVVPVVTVDLLLTLVAGASGWKPDPLVVLPAFSLGVVWSLCLIVLAGTSARRGDPERDE